MTVHLFGGRLAEHHFVQAYHRPILTVAALREIVLNNGTTRFVLWVQSWRQFGWANVGWHGQTNSQLFEA